MKLVRVSCRGEARFAVVEGDEYRLVDGSLFGEWSASREVVDRESVHLLAPVEPPQVIAVGLNYRAHADEGGADVPAAPLLFAKTCNTVIGPGEPIVLPAMAPTEVDYEAELVIVVGRRAKHVSRGEAAEYILGYTCGNDVSARDCQLKLDKQWTRGKSFDTFAPLGPHIVTEIDPLDLRIRSVLNGDVMQDARTSEMVFDCFELFSYVSHCMTLLPGSVIMTGTPAGVGFTREPPVFLRDGDVVAVEIEGVGRLENPVTAERQPGA